MNSLLPNFSPSPISARTKVEIGVETNKVALRRFAWRLCRNNSDVDDLVQETICTALEKAELYDCSYRILPWLFTMMRRLNVDRFRRDEKERNYAVTTFVEGTTPVPHQSWVLECRTVSNALSALSEPKRQAILQIANGESYIGGASACGCDVNTMKTRVRRARQELVDQVGNIFIKTSTPRSLCSGEDPGMPAAAYLPSSR